MKLTYEYIPTIQGVIDHIKTCEGRHTQQAIYSTFHNALTQICFGCLKVRSTIYRKQPDKEDDGEVI